MGNGAGIPRPVPRRHRIALTHGTPGPPPPRVGRLPVLELAWTSSSCTSAQPIRCSGRRRPAARPPEGASWAPPPRARLGETPQGTCCRGSAGPTSGADGATTPSRVNLRREGRHDRVRHVAARGAAPRSTTATPGHAARHLRAMRCGIGPPGARRARRTAARTQPQFALLETKGGDAAEPRGLARAARPRVGPAFDARRAGETELAALRRIHPDFANDAVAVAARAHARRATAGAR